MKDGFFQFAMLCVLAAGVGIIASLPRAIGLRSQDTNNEELPTLAILVALFFLVMVAVFAYGPNDEMPNPFSPKQYWIFLTPLLLGLGCSYGRVFERTGESGSVRKRLGVLLQRLGGGLIGAGFVISLITISDQRNTSIAALHDPATNTVIGRVTALSREMTIYNTRSASLHIPPSQVFFLQLNDYSGMLYVSGLDRCTYLLKVGDRVRLRYTPPEKADRGYFASAFVAVQWLEILKKGEIPKESLLRRGASVLCEP